MTYLLIAKAVISGLLIGLGFIYGGTACLTKEHPAKTDLFLTAFFFIFLAQAIAP